MSDLLYKIALTKINGVGSITARQLVSYCGGAKEVFEAFKFDKKNISGSLQMILLKGVGKPAIMTTKDIPQVAVKTAIKKLLQQ